MKYTTYKVDDFLKDEYFKHWVLHPDVESEFFWSSFLQHNPDKQEDVSIARSILLSLSFTDHKTSSLSDQEREELYQKIINKNIGYGEDIQPFEPNSYWFRLNEVLRVAVIILMVVCTSIIWHKLSMNEVSDIKEAHEIRMIKKSTTPGQKLLVQLSDSSTIKLNSGSSIIYPENFKENREVILDGEAFFDVAKLSNSTFTIKTGEYTTRVLGTAFNIRYNINTGVRVAVLRGKVEVNKRNLKNNTESKVYLEPYEMVECKSYDEEFKKGFVEYNQMFGWTEDKIYFKNNNIKEVLTTLEDWYGVHFVIKKSTSNNMKDFTGMYQNQDLESVLKGLSFTFDFKYKINGKEVIIY